MVLSSADIFFKSVCFFFSKKKSGVSSSRVSSSLDPDHALGPDLGPNCL